jgi:hypothetical protein
VEIFSKVTQFNNTFKDKDGVYDPVDAFSPSGPDFLHLVEKCAERWA